MMYLAIIMVLSQQPVPPLAEGEASYYTVASSSSITASGEPMRDDALTCAMLAGEFGTYYRVEADNGKSVVVRLNDRGPYVADRVIDLSEAAIRKLHPRDGLLNVRVYKAEPLASTVESPPAFDTPRTEDQTDELHTPSEHPIGASTVLLGGDRRRLFDRGIASGGRLRLFDQGISSGLPRYATVQASTDLLHQSSLFEWFAELVREMGAVRPDGGY